MESPLSYHQQQQPNRIIISLALVQSELFWLCSAFFCIFQESGLIKKPIIKPIKHSRTRSHSEPLQLLTEETMKTKKDRKAQAHRRLSLPTETSEDASAAVVEIRKRPTTQDELTGTTCPPIWWQKTRVMLGHAPVHGDPKPRSIHKPAPSSSIHLTQIETNCSSHQRMSASSSSTSFSSVATNNSKSIYSLSPVASGSSALSSQSAPSISSSTKRHSAAKKLVTKLNSAFRLRKS